MGGVCIFTSGYTYESVRMSQYIHILLSSRLFPWRWWRGGSLVFLSAIAAGTEAICGTGVPIQKMYVTVVNCPVISRRPVRGRRRIDRLALLWASRQ